MAEVGSIRSRLGEDKVGVIERNCESMNRQKIIL